MAASHESSICVKVGEFAGKDGKVKSQYKKIGRVMRKDDGGRFILLDASCISMQLFALANKDRRDSIVCSILDEQREAPAQAAPDAGGEVPF